MNCEVVIKISKSDLKVYYSQNKNSFKIFNYEDSESIPFYVYSDGNSFEIGNPAKIKFQNNFSNSYFNFFKLIKETKSTFPFLDGEDKKMGFLIIYSIEKIIKELFKVLLIDDDLSDIRDSIALNLVMSSDISDVEINFLVSLFKDFGYKKCKYLFSSYLILYYLDNNRKIGAFKSNNSNMGSFKGYVVIDVIDNDLQIDFFESLNKKFPKLHEEGIDLASNPKVKIIAKEMFKQTADFSGSLTTEKNELPLLIPLAQKYALSLKNEFRVKVVLSDGAEKNVKIKMSKIDSKVSYHAKFTKDFDLVELIVERSKIKNVDLAFVIRKSVASQDFIDKIKSNYNNFYLSDDDFVDIFELFNSNRKVINIGDFDSKLETETSTIPPPKVTSIPKRAVGSIPSSPTEVTKVNIKTGGPLPPPMPKIAGAPKVIKKTVVSKTKRPVGPPPPPPPPRIIGSTKTVKKTVVSKTKRPSSPPPPPPPPKIPGTSKPVNRPVSAKPKIRSGSLPPPPPPPPKTPGTSKPVKKTASVKKIMRKKTGAPPPPPPPPPPSRKS